MKILLVEDEPGFGASIQQKLSKERYIVDWLLDGDEAGVVCNRIGMNTH